MALPALEKTYQFNVNNLNNAAATDTENYQRLLLALKNAFIGFGTLPWTVVGSSNSSVAGMDAVDRWSTYTNLVWNTSAAARSWIVLKNTGLAANFQLLFALTSNGAANEYGMDIVVSPSAGFTGSSTTARPTATDEVVIHNGSTGLSWIGNYATNGFTTVHHVLKSTDGQVTRWVVCSQGKVISFFSIEKAADAVTGWTVPVVVISPVLTSTGTDVNKYSDLNDLATGAASFLSTTKFTLYMTAEGFISATNGEQLNITANQISNEWMMGPVGFASTDTPYRGRHGRAYDLWWASQMMENATTFPSDSTRQFAVFGDLIIPWDGTIPKIF